MVYTHQNSVTAIERQQPFDTSFPLLPWGALISGNLPPSSKVFHLWDAPMKRGQVLKSIEFYLVFCQRESHSNRGYSI